MFNRKIEGTPRSKLLYQAIAYQPLLAEPGSFPPPVDEKSLELARLFAAEEELAEKIKDNDQMVDKDTIYQIVTLARRIARAGFATNLVNLDEFLDIAQIYYLDEPDVDPRTCEWWASQKLVTLLASLKDQDNPTWTARVAAALAYFSAASDPISRPAI